jgi:hypothetical protein
MKMDEVELSTRAAGVIEKLGIKTVAEWAEFDWMAFAKQPNCGKLTIAELAKQAIELASGKMIKRAREWDKKYPSRQFDWARLHDAERKARLWDKVVEIVEPNASPSSATR